MHLDVELNPYAIALARCQELGLLVVGVVRGQRVGGYVALETYHGGERREARADGLRQLRWWVSSKVAIRRETTSQ